MPYGVALKAATEAGASEIFSLWAFPVAVVAATWWWLIGLPAMKCPSCSAELEPQWSACVTCGHVVREIGDEDAEDEDVAVHHAEPLWPQPTIDEAELDELWVTRENATKHDDHPGGAER